MESANNFSPGKTLTTLDFVQNSGLYTMGKLEQQTI